MKNTITVRGTLHAEYPDYAGPETEAMLMGTLAATQLAPFHEGKRLQFGVVDFQRTKSAKKPYDISDFLDKLQMFFVMPTIDIMQFKGILHVVIDNALDFTNVPVIHEVIVDKGIIQYKEGSISWSQEFPFRW